MKEYYILCSFIFALLVQNIQAQNVGIGTTTPNTNAALEISSSTKGLLIPRTSTASRNGIAAPPKGLMVYDTSFSAFYYYDGGRWLPVGEKNYDSSSIDYFNVNGASVNLPTSVSGANVSVTGNSGFIYDNGGPFANYFANNFSYSQIFFDDSTLQIKITVEEMNAETFYDSLFIIQYNGDEFTDTIATFTGAQLGTVTANNAVRIYFKSNGINQLAGFKIRWGKLRNSGASQTDVPFYGWHFNNSKMAAMGGVQRQNNWHKDSIGFGSLNYGVGAKAKGNYSTAIGKYATTLGNYSTTIGSNAIASGNYSTALGFNTFATGEESIAIGRSTFATGFGSTAMGYFTLASGFYSTAMGFYSKSLGSYSIAMGYFTKASGNFSTALGSSTIASGYSSTAVGFNTSAAGYSSLVVGMYNDSLVAAQTAVTTTTPLFIVGNGNTSTDRSNALVVLKNGNVGIGDNGNPVNPLHITGGTIGSLSNSSGYITTGAIEATNMVIDNDGLQGRVNGAASNLYLQTYGSNVGIGSTGVPAFQLEITGTAGKPGGGSWSNASDRRLKQNINPYTQGLQQLLQINPVTYQYNEKSGFDTKPEYVGIIAQDLQKIAPYMVSTVKRKDAEYLSVDNSAMTYMLINAVKEQQQQIELLKAEIELLKKANK
jgi:hypothetical protein